MRCYLSVQLIMMTTFVAPSENVYCFHPIYINDLACLNRIIVQLREIQLNLQPHVQKGYYGSKSKHRMFSPKKIRSNWEFHAQNAIVKEHRIQLPLVLLFLFETVRTHLYQGPVVRSPVSLNGG